MSAIRTFRLAVLALLLSCSPAMAQGATKLFILTDNISGPSRPLVPEEDYFTISVKTMNIEDDLIGFSRFYSAVHGVFQFADNRNGTVQIESVTKPSFFGKLGSRRYKRIEYFNNTLLGPVPYVGDKLGFKVGVLAVKQEDFSEPYVNFLGSVAEAAGVSIITEMLPFVPLVKQGVELITGTSGDALLEAAWDTSFNTPRTGLYVIMWVEDPQSFSPGDYSLKRGATPDDVYLVNSPDQSQLEDVSYAVVEISASKERRDWRELPGIRESRNLVYDLLYSVGQGEEAARIELANLVNLVRRSLDLQRDDQDRLIAYFRTEFETQVVKYRDDLNRIESQINAGVDPESIDLMDIQRPMLERAQPF